MQTFADLTVQVKTAILSGEKDKIGALMDANFDLRRSICRLPQEQILMIETARHCGVSAKFAGSGGAIIGTYPDEATFDRLRTAMLQIGCSTVKPIVS